MEMTCIIGCVLYVGLLHECEQQRQREQQQRVEHQQFGGSRILSQWSQNGNCIG